MEREMCSYLEPGCPACSRQQEPEYNLGVRRPWADYPDTIMPSETGCTADRDSIEPDGERDVLLPQAGSTGLLTPAAPGI